MSKISPGCKRITIDLPLDLYEKVQDLADTTPAIPVSEWVRRVVAHFAKYELPPLRDRQRTRTRLDGGKKYSRTSPSANGTTGS